MRKRFKLIFSQGIKIRLILSPFLYLLFILYAPLNLKANFDFNANCQKAYSEIFQLRFNNATNLISMEEKNNPSNKIPAYLRHYLLFYKSFISEEQVDFTALKKSHQQMLSLLQNEDENSPYYLYCKAETEITLSFLKIKNKEYVSGAVALRRGYKMLEENKVKFPSFKPNLKALGIIHAFIGAVPENYSWLLKIAGMYGTINQGINELGDLFYSSSINSSPYKFLNTEAQFIFIFSKQYLQKDEAELAAIYEKVNPANGPLQLFAKMNYHYYRYNGEKVMAILLERKNLSYDYPLHYLDYMEGLARLNKLDTASSTYFYKYITNFKGTGFIKSAYQKIAWMELIMGHKTGYEQAINKIKSAGSDFTDEDKQAQAESENKIVPNIYLLKARVLFDGGYFKEALMQLSDKPHGTFSSIRESLELNYRLARIYDKMHNHSQAINFYEATIKNGEKTSYYYASNAALQAGVLCESTKDTAKAIAYYRRALQMRNHEYQNSIDQKAKAGLNRLGKSE